MKLVTFITPDDPRAPKLGAMVNDTVVDLAVAQTWAQGARGLPPKPLAADMLSLLSAGPEAMSAVREVVEAIGGDDPTRLKGAHRKPVGFRQSDVHLLPPLTQAVTLRDFYAFEQHVKTANANRGREVPPEWYEFPVFYFSNPNAIYGPNESVPRPKASTALDYELEIACVIGAAGKDIPVEKAEDHIAGYTIMNDWSARDIQRQEMKVGLGPAKGKDFATSLGPWLVTPEELEERRSEVRSRKDEGKSRGSVYDLEMVARVNGVERSRGNWKDIHYTFAEMIARASADVWLV
ncbi:MAG: fumarylacetoacetate hydrolase family protein, partial [Chloroflexi bacterium]|nr:fumarylacetoacetate hydrolase family protein [Chloroflexota bacterium]